jgi:hypothetical protein
LPSRIAPKFKASKLFCPTFPPKAWGMESIEPGSLRRQKWSCMVNDGYTSFQKSAQMCSAILHSNHARYHRRRLWLPSLPCPQVHRAQTTRRRKRTRCREIFPKDQRRSSGSKRDFRRSAASVCCHCLLVKVSAGDAVCNLFHPGKECAIEGILVTIAKVVIDPCERCICLESAVAVQSRLPV